MNVKTKQRWGRGWTAEEARVRKEDEYSAGRVVSTVDKDSEPETSHTSVVSSQPLEESSETQIWLPTQGLKTWEVSHKNTNFQLEGSALLCSYFFRAAVEWDQGKRPI